MMKAVMRDEREMKDSGIEWIGQLPMDWTVMTIKYTSWLKGRIGWQGLKSTEFVDNGPYLITGTDFKNGIVNWETCAHITDDRFIEDEDIHIVEDDLLITKDGTIGKVAIAKNCPEKVSLNSGVLLIRNDKIKYIDKYLYYTLLSEEFILWYELNQPQNSTIRHLYQGQFYNFKFAFPHYDEQQAIANYLDDRCSKIDAIIAEAKASIEEYKELKQAVIYEAVTKGLDKNVSMKDSGIEWIGKIPKQWKIARLGRGLEFIQTGPFGSQLHSDEYIEDGIPVVNPANIKNLEIKIDNKCTLSTEKANELQQHIMTPHEIVFGRRGEMGRCACVPDDGKTYFCGTGCIRMRCNNLLYSDYLILFLSSETAKQYYELNSVGTTMSNLNSEIISATPTLYPPIDEQRNIVSHINEIVPKYDNLIIEKQSLIEDLEAYKKSLIYEVVTGKRKVVA